MTCKTSRDAAVVVQAQALATIYRSLSVELLNAADGLEQVTGADDRLPAISLLRMTEAMRGAMILHYLADQAIEPVPIQPSPGGSTW
jgi:hypothetical protein